MTSITVEAVRERLEAIESTLTSYDLDMKGARMEKGILLADGNELLIDPPARSQFLQALQIPEPFFNRVPLDAKDYLVNRMIQEKPEPVPVLVDTIGQNRIVSFLQNQFVPGSQVLSNFIEATQAMGQDFGDLDFRINPTGFSLQVLGDRLQVEPKKNDISRGGIRLSHNFTGIQPTTVNNFLYRLACLNGMEVVVAGSGENSGSLRLPGNDGAPLGDWFQTFRQRAQQQWSFVMDRLNHYATLYQMRIDNPIQYLDAFAKKHRIGKEAYNAIITAFNTDPENMDNMAGIVNAMTNVATHGQDLALTTRERLNSLAVDRLMEDHASCPWCKSQITAN